MIRALKGKMIVRLDKKEIKSESGIEIKLSDEEQPYGTGLVISVTDVPDIAKGDYVLFDDCVKSRIFEMDGKQYIKLDPKEIICKVVDNKPVPILNKVLVEEGEDYEKSAGGIYIPEKYRKGSCFGKVIDTGKGIIGLKGNRVPTVLLKGETILFSQWKKIEIEINSNKYTIIREDSIVAIIDSPDLNSRIEREKWRN
jgi:chaperonin GroES